MPWEKSFDLDEATDKAIKVFWKKGYEATSMSDLIEGMGINKGSLYNAFGSKKELFERALLRYDRLNRQAALTQLAELGDPVGAIERLFDGMIAETEADDQHKGCLLVNTAQELPNHPDDVKAMVTRALGELEDFFRQMITQGKEAGQIPDGVDADETAKALLSLVVALRVLARGAYKADDLKALKSSAMRLIS